MNSPAVAQGPINNPTLTQLPSAPTAPVPELPIQELRALHLPDPVGFWPPAPGWWLLGMLVVTAIAYIAWRFYARRQRNGYRRAALQLINQLDKALENKITSNINNDTQDTEYRRFYIYNLCEILKRTALTAYPQDSANTQNSASIKSLTGEAWVEFLLQACPALGNNADNRADKNNDKPKISTNSLSREQLNQVYKSIYSANANDLAEVDTNAMTSFCKTWVIKHQQHLKATPEPVQGGAHAHL